MRTNELLVPVAKDVRSNAALRLVFVLVVALLTIAVASLRFMVVTPTMKPILESFSLSCRYQCPLTLLRSARAPLRSTSWDRFGEMPAWLQQARDICEASRFPNHAKKGSWSDCMSLQHNLLYEKAIAEGGRRAAVAECCMASGYGKGLGATTNWTLRPDHATGVAVRGYPQAQTELSSQPLTNAGTDSNVTTAIHWCTQAACAGDEVAMLLLVHIYFDNAALHPDFRNYEQAKCWLGIMGSLSAVEPKLGIHPWSAERDGMLAKVYREGLGVPVDKLLADQFAASANGDHGYPQPGYERYGFWSMSLATVGLLVGGVCAAIGFARWESPSDLAKMLWIAANRAFVAASGDELYHAMINWCRQVDWRRVARVLAALLVLLAVCLSSVKVVQAFQSKFSEELLKLKLWWSPPRILYSRHLSDPRYTSSTAQRQY